MQRLYNFSPGPSMLPAEVLLQAQEEMLNWRGLGMSVMEISHRSAEFSALLAEIVNMLWLLLSIPNNYHVLFIPGGASAQFSMLPLNLLSANNLQADYIVTGRWSEKAFTEAKRYGRINLLAVNKMIDGLNYVPTKHDFGYLNPQSSYVHYTPNETVDGLEFADIPEVGDLPLVADMTSLLMSKPVDVNKFGIIYAAVQKNLGQAGVTIVVIRDDLIQSPLSFTPILYNYQTYVEHNSCYNTPPTYAIYFTGLMLDWIKRQGGLIAISERNMLKSQKLYQCIDQYSDFYRSSVAPKCRSTMNVVFHLQDQALTTKFLSEAAQRNLVNLKGHSAVGGIRASIYNAMPESGVDLLVEFMRDFAIKNYSR